MNASVAQENSIRMVNCKLLLDQVSKYVPHYNSSLRWSYKRLNNIKTHTIALCFICNHDSIRIIYRNNSHFFERDKSRGKKYRTNTMWKSIGMSHVMWLSVASYLSFSQKHSDTCVMNFVLCLLIRFRKIFIIVFYVFLYDSYFINYVSRFTLKWIYTRKIRKI